MDDTRFLSLEGLYYFYSKLKDFISSADIDIVTMLKKDIDNIESVLTIMQARLNEIQQVQSLIVDDINVMDVSYFENKHVLEVDV